MILQLRSVLTAAAAAACTASFFWMDCNPTLFVADKWLRHVSNNRRNAFDNQRIWIVGASSGIGEELAYQLAAAVVPSTNRQQHCHSRLHLILSSRSADKLEQVAATCRASNPECTVTVLALDVCREEDLRSAVQRLTAANEPIDSIVLNSGSGQLSPALETSAATAESVWKLNALWPMILTPLLFEYNIFPEHKRPHLVVTSSIAAIMPVPLSATYAAAKHALTGYFRSLAAERPDILLHTVMPGPVDTDFHQNHVKTTATASGGNHVELPRQASTTKKSKYKMSVQRCVRLIRSTMLLRHSTESWIAMQPILTALYLQQWAPAFMHTVVYSKIGPKRVDMWRAGLDLYDPTSLKKLRNNKKNDQ
jgi:dehydrogenase/reductase SDR family member 7